MCWSWPVSFIFATVQWLIIAYLYHRNQFLDRILATMQSLIAAQETLQFFLWAFGINDDTTDTLCSAFNTFCSYCLLLIVQSIMPVYGVTASIISHKTDKGSRRYYAVLIYTLIAFVWYILYVIAAIYYDFYRDDVHCTYKGPNGHQVWGFMDIEDLSAVIFWVNNWIWSILIVVFITCVYPSWPILPVAVYSAVSLFIFNRAFETTYEYGSLWCWANFAEAIWYLFTYHVAKYVVEHEMEDKNGFCFKHLFHGTKKIYDNAKGQVKEDTCLHTVRSQSTI